METNEQPAPLSPATLYILLALAAQDLHGYGILQQVGSLSNEAYRIGPGTLYDNLKKLLNQGLVEDYEADDAGETRRMYSLTDEGRQLLAADVNRMKRVVRVANRMLAGGGA